MKNYLLSRRVVGVASLLPDQNPSAGRDRPSSQVVGKPSTNLRSSFASWCAPIIVFLAVIMLGFAVAAVLLGEK